MAQVTFSPPFTAPSDVASQLRQAGYAVLSPADVARWVGCDLSSLMALNGDWAALPPDDFLKDGGRYRRRRHACFVVQGGRLQQAPHRAHWQPVEYNALHGGMERWFEPLSNEMIHLPSWSALLVALGELFAKLRAPQGGRWYIEAHPFRIDTEGGVGRPTPEGAHRDGVDFVAVVFIGRQGVRGGETRVFDAAGPQGVRFTLEQPWTVLLLDDQQVIHESTPLLPLDPADPAVPAHRDTLVLTYRSGGFQAPA